MKMNLLMVFGVVFVFGSINGSSMTPFNRKMDRFRQLLRDNRGCDAVVQSCGHRGACCDTHDECYAIYGCTAHSWLTMWYDWDNCAHCNIEAMRCVAFHQPGESSCCHREDCGQPWK